MRITNKIRQDVYLTGKRSILSNLPLPSILNFRFIYANLTHAQSLCLCLEITNLSGDILLKNPVSGLFTHVTRIEIVTRDFIGRTRVSDAPVKLLLKTCYGFIQYSAIGSVMVFCIRISCRQFFFCLLTVNS